MESILRFRDGWSMSLGRHPGFMGSQRVLQVLGTPGTGMEAYRWILEVQPPHIGKGGLDISPIGKMGV